MISRSDKDKLEGDDVSVVLPQVYSIIQSVIGTMAKGHVVRQNLYTSMLNRPTFRSDEPRFRELIWIILVPFRNCKSLGKQFLVVAPKPPAALFNGFLVAVTRHLVF